eukprot:368444-Pyramimonas_sp.AAC.1
MTAQKSGASNQGPDKSLQVTRERTWASPDWGAKASASLQTPSHSALNSHGSGAPKHANRLRHLNRLAAKS